MTDIRSGRLAVLISFSGDGGVERMVLNLIGGIVERGHAVDLLTLRGNAAMLGTLPEAVRWIPLGVRHSVLAPPVIARYLRRERPRALLAAKDRAIRAAVHGRRLSGVPTRLVGRLGTNLSAALAHRPALQRWWRSRPLPRGYAPVDHLVAVSAGVAADVVAMTGLAAERVSVICNPVVGARLHQLARQPAGHDWFGDGGAPIVLGVGRLTAQKDFATLVRAFAQLRRRQPVRLVIAGEGRLRAELLTLAASLGVADDVSLPGFLDNPYACMARADVFALSSAWEGSPNVLTEALALGTPAVATDCPSGPREVLDGGRYGPLVTVGDAAQLAAALATTLSRRPERGLLQAAVAEYTVERSTERYLAVLGMTEEPGRK